MKTRILSFSAIVFIATALLSGCNPKDKQAENTSETGAPSFPEKPARQAEEGFIWEKVSGAGLEFWAQRSDSIQVGTSETLPGAFIEWIRDGHPVATRLVMQVFELKNGKIEDVIEQLKVYNDWNEADSCQFQPIESNRPGVERYVLMPTGKALEEFKELGTREPICTTCGSWGMGNSGTRYFEIHANSPHKALFVEIGQEAPLFDEQSIMIK